MLLLLERLFIEKKTKNELFHLPLFPLEFS